MARDRGRERITHREDLAGEHRLGDAGQALFACLFGAVWIGDTFFLQSTTSLNAYAPLWVRIPLGIALLVLAGWMARTGLNIVFGEERTKPGVIRKGVFNWVRHPIYLSEILLYLGLLVMSLSLASAVVWIAAIAFLHVISRHEERLLLDRFGEDYARYMREVAMWIPRIRRHGARSIER
ncbi:MAG: isoprenylcysteine carboxylmethyltransferase family protein [Desulfobacteraceae bacterium]|jgi:protein-S-isoprenylcysteine O-methyltransferase Ste14